MNKGNKIGVVSGIFLCLLVILLAGCKIKSTGSPTIISISPNALLANQSFTLTINGTGFTRQSVIVFNHREQTTYYKGENRLECEFTTEKTVPPGSDSLNVPVYVRNETTGDGDQRSETHYFTIQTQPEFSAPVFIGTAPSYTSSHQFSIGAMILNEMPRFYLTYYLYDSSQKKYDCMLSISQDSGQSWSPAYKLSSGSLHFVRDGTFYSWGVSDGYIIRKRSYDSGLTHTSDNVAALDQEKDFAGYTVRIDSQDTIYLAYAEEDDDYNLTFRLLTSTDYGDSWEQKYENVFDSRGYFSLSLTWMAMNHSGVILVGYSYPYGRYGGIGSFRSTNGGQTFEDTGPGFDYAKYIYIDENNRLYVLSESMIMPYSWRLRFFVADNLGRENRRYQMFEEFKTDESDMIMDNMGNLYIVMGDRMIRSIDDGENWSEPAFFTSATGADNAILAEDPSGVIYIVWNDKDSILLSTITNR